MTSTELNRSCLVAAPLCQTLVAPGITLINSHMQLISIKYVINQLPTFFRYHSSSLTRHRCPPPPDPNPWQLRQDVGRMLESLGFPEKRASLAGTLSGGQKRRLCVGISMIGGNAVVYLDEVGPLILLT